MSVAEPGRLAVAAARNHWLQPHRIMLLAVGAAIVGFNELTLETRQAAGATKAYFTFFMAAGVLYLLLTLFSNVIIARVERWARRGMPALGGGPR